MTWACFIHAAGREVLHLSAACSLTLAMLLVWSEVARAGWLWRLRGLSFWIVPPVFGVFLFVGFKEPFDVLYAVSPCQVAGAGDSPWKSVADLCFWMIGCGLASAGLYRAAPRLHGARDATQRQLRQMRARRGRAAGP